MRLDTSFEAIYSACLLMCIFYLGPLVTSAVYLYVSYYHGVDGSGVIGEKKGKDRFSSFFAYVWDLNLRYLHTFNVTHLEIEVFMKSYIMTLFAYVLSCFVCH